MLSITDLKKGTVFQLDGVPYKVVSYAQKVMGRGGSIVNVKIKSLIDGRVLERTLKGNERLESAHITSRPVQYLYSDANAAHFMDTNNYEQFSVGLEELGDSVKLFREGQNATAQLFNAQVINVELPTKIELKVETADPGIKGDTVSNVMKSATLETGARLQVPLFINPGDRVVVDTRNGSYVERAK